MTHTEDLEYSEQILWATFMVVLTDGVSFLESDNPGFHSLTMYEKKQFQHNLYLIEE